MGVNVAVVVRGGAVGALRSDGSGSASTTVRQRTTGRTATRANTIRVGSASATVTIRIRRGAVQEVVAEVNAVVLRVAGGLVRTRDVLHGPDMCLS